MSSRLISARFPFLLRQDHPHNTGMGCAFLFTDRLRVNIHRGPRISVPQQFLLNFNVDSELPQHGAVGVSKGMPSHAVRKPSGYRGWLNVVRQYRS